MLSRRPRPSAAARTAIGAPNDNQRPPPAPFIGIERRPSRPTALTPCSNPKAAPRRWIRVKVWGCRVNCAPVRETLAWLVVGRWDLGLKDGCIVATDSVDKGLRFLTSLRYVRNDSLSGALISESLLHCEGHIGDEGWACRDSSVDGSPRALGWVPASAGTTGRGVTRLFS